MVIFVFVFLKVLFVLCFVSFPFWGSAPLRRGPRPLHSRSVHCFRELLSAPPAGPFPVFHSFLIRAFSDFCKNSVFIVLCSLFFIFLALRFLLSWSRSLARGRAWTRGPASPRPSRRKPPRPSRRARPPALPFSCEGPDSWILPCSSSFRVALLLT